MVDLLIVGGGVMGLWAAVMAERAGLRSILIERDHLGAGASGGVLGALMPHMPDRWNEKKQFQFDALVSLEQEIAGLEAETGLNAGYRRSGRLIPLPRPHLRTIALRHEEEARSNWTDGSRAFRWEVRNASPVPGWPDPSVTESGVILDTLAARVSPRALLELLAASLKQRRQVTVRERCCLTQIDPTAGVAQFGDGTALSFGHCILANGVSAFPFIDGISGALLPSGTAVKGQAAVLSCDVDPGFPVIFLDGLYVVPHDDGRVAVGSTSEDDFDNPQSTDGQLDQLIARATSIVPALRDVPVVERWAELRPKAIGRDPMVGVHPDHPRIHVLTGGFKISFGIAHRLAQAVIGEIVGDAGVDIPPSFRCETHINLVRTSNRNGNGPD